MCEHLPGFKLRPACGSVSRQCFCSKQFYISVYYMEFEIKLHQVGQISPACRVFTRSDLVLENYLSLIDIGCTNKCGRSPSVPCWQTLQFTNTYPSRTNASILISAEPLYILYIIQSSLQSCLLTI